MIVAIPKFNDVVAPCFEAARYFFLATTEARAITRSAIVACSGCEGFGRIQLLRDRKVEVLICNGINAFYRDVLQSMGMQVVANVSAPVKEALDDWIAGRLLPDHGDRPEIKPEESIPLDDLVCWTRELFASHGYRVKPGEDTASFPVDLVAEITCPVCDRTVRIAICCGSHMYRTDREIRELYQSARLGFDARVYVHPSSDTVERCCRQFEIELIDPNARFASRDHRVPGRIPILRNAIPGHERASAPAPEEP